MKNVFEKRRDLMIDLLKEISGLKVNKPMGAFYLFPDVSSFFGLKADGETIKDADDLCMYLLRDGLVACTSGSAFGCPENIRISYANSEEQLKEAVKRMKASFEKLK